LRHLKVGEWRPEQIARRRTVDAFVHRAARQAERGSRDGRAEDIKRRHRDLESAARHPKAICDRNPAT